MNGQYKFTFVPSDQPSDWIEIGSADSHDMAKGYGFALSSNLSRNEDLRASWPGEYVMPAVPTFLIDVPSNITSKGGEI